MTQISRLMFGLLALLIAGSPAAQTAYPEKPIHMVVGFPPGSSADTVTRLLGQKLARDDGVGLEESAVICAYLDHLDGNPAFDLPAGDQSWEARRLEALARSMLDGLSVWGREILRPQDERSPTVLQHETNRSGRMADLWEAEIDRPSMRGALNLAQITLACALGLEARNPDLRWRPGHPGLCDWFDHIAARPSFAATAPPAPR